MSRSLVLSVSILALVASSGCSSSSSTGSPPPGGGSNDDSGVTTNPADGSTTTTPDSGTTGAADSGSTSNDDSGSGGNTCSPATDAGTYASVTYVPAVKGNNQCAATDIANFISVCVTGTSQAACTSWFETNVAGQAADGGGAGTTCGNCIAPAQNNGGIWNDPNGYFAPNYAGCIQLTDATNGSACAAAYNNFYGCQGQYCDECTAGYGSCANTVAGSTGECASYTTPFSTACAADLGLGDAGTALGAACFPSMGGMDPSPDYTYVLNLICGTGTPDGGM